MKILNTIFNKRVGTFNAQLFVNDTFDLSIFDRDHIIHRWNVEKLYGINPLLFQADPFLFAKNDELFLFYELQYWGSPAYIAMTKTNDLTTWSKPMVVLKEPFHLSFPFVFEDKGEIYMIPESQEKDSIRLYKGNEDLTSFTFCRTILKKERCDGLIFNYSDSFIYKKDNVYYLFTSFFKDWKYVMELYYSDDLESGVFKPHPKSPICINNKYGRNGGSMINYGDKLFRVSQDCSQAYGESVALHEVLVLNINDYDEKLYMDDLFIDNPLFPEGGHQLNILKYRDYYVYATDYKKNVWSWYNLYLIIKGKVSKLL